MSVSNFIQLLSDISVGVAAAVGAYVAYQGLSAWKTQLKGHTEYDLSRRLLITLYKYRDAIESVRNPVMWGHETPEPSESESSKMDYSAKRHYGISKAYQARWEKVHIERSKLYADLLEAEVLWSTALEELFKVLFQLEHELFLYIQNFLKASNPTDQDYRAYANINAVKRNIMYGTQENDNFKTEFKTGIVQIEKFLKPKLTSNV
jgi:hypothetical protein